MMLYDSAPHLGGRVSYIETLLLERDSEREREGRGREWKTEVKSRASRANVNASAGASANKQGPVAGNANRARRVWGKPRERGAKSMELARAGGERTARRVTNTIQLQHTHRTHTSERTPFPAPSPSALDSVLPYGSRIPDSYF